MVREKGSAPRNQHGLIAEADPLKIGSDFDAVLIEVLSVADAGEHQQVRRVEHSVTDDNLNAFRNLGLATVQVFNACRSSPFEETPRGVCASNHLEVAAASCDREKGHGSAHPT